MDRPTFYTVVAVPCHARGTICFTFAVLFAIIQNAVKKYAPVAQLDRAMASDAMCRWFESSRACQNKDMSFSNREDVSFFIIRYMIL